MSSVTGKKLIMLDLDIIASVEWSAEFGKRLKDMRGKVSRRSLAAMLLAKYEYKVSQQYIQLLEHPDEYEKAPSTVSFKLLRYLTEALGRDIYELFGSPKILSNNS